MLNKAGADVNQKDESGRTPLMFAVRDNPKVVSALLEAGANVNDKTIAKATAHIKRRDGCELIDQRVNRCRVVNDPHPMAHPVIGHKIDGGVHLFDLIRQRRNGFLMPISQKNRTGIGIAGIHVTNAVLLFIRPGQLVLFDRSVQIFIDGGAGDNARLAVSVHRQFVKIQARGFVQIGRAHV